MKSRASAAAGVYKRQDDDDEWSDEKEGETPEDKKIKKIFTGAIKDNGFSDGQEKIPQPILITTLPTKAQFRAWRLSLRSNVTAVARDADSAFEWIIEVEKVGCEIEDFASPGDKHQLLDAALAAALCNVATGDSGRVMTLKTESEALGKTQNQRSTAFVVGL